MFICILPCLYGSYLRVNLKQDSNVTLNFECRRHALSAIVTTERVHFHSALLPHK